MSVLKMKFLPSAVQKLSSEQTRRQTDGQTDTQTDRQTRLKLLPTAYADGKKLTLLTLVTPMIIQQKEPNFAFAF